MFRQFTGTLVAATLFAAAAPQLFDYDRKTPFSVEVKSHETRDGIAVQDITYARLNGSRNSAYLVPGKGGTPHPAILFVHWLEPEAPDSNRTEFLPEAIELARDGVTSLLIETMWSDKEWFNKRDKSQDYATSVEQVKELRRALDLLLRQPGVDPKRIAYVGHDFGGMYGAALAAEDHRVSAWVIMAATPRFGEWFVLGWKLTPEEKTAVIARTAAIDPVKHIAAAAPAPVLFQFGKHDPYVPEARAREFFDAAREPKELKLYDAGHPLNSESTADRRAWLRQRLLAPGPRPK